MNGKTFVKYKFDSLIKRNLQSRDEGLNGEILFPMEKKKYSRQVFKKEKHLINS